MNGNEALLNCEKIGFLASRRVPPEAVMRCLVLARRMWDERHIPTLFRKPLAEGRLLVVSPVSQSIRRVDARSIRID